VKLPLTPLGSSPLSVTRIGLGLAALGRPGYINLGHADDLNRQYDIDAMEGHAHDVLDAAWMAGVRYFDCARSYGRAEQFLASWLHRRNIPPEAVIVGSKWGYTYTANWQVKADVHEVKEHSLDVLRRQWIESKGTLGRHLRLYQIHSATLDSGVLDNDDVLHGLAGLKRIGVVIGLTLSGPRQADTLHRALTIQRNGQRLFDTVQATWNVLEPSTGPALAAARAAGMGVLVKEALANGRLTPRNAANPEFRDPYAVLQAQADRLQTTVDALALAAVLAQPWADVVLSGAAQADHLRANLAALNVAWDEQAAAALGDLAEEPDAYWQTRSRLAWQ
jgi:aryl-alcohol dehydrogenase-like predicted oxidoreductase